MTSKGKSNWKRIDAMTDEEIEEAALSDPDAQPTTYEFWQDAEIVIPKSEFQDYFKVDHDIVEWFKSQGKDYKGRMNAVLREHVKAKDSEN